MARTVVLLRGVNVGGRSLPMGSLRAALERAGCRNVVTYVQSGNVVLSPPTPAPQNLAAEIERIVSDTAGFDVPVVLRTPAELERTVARNPYPQASGAQLHVVFYAAPPPAGVLDGIDLAAFAPEECTLIGAELYLHVPHGMGRAKLPVELEKAERRQKSVPVATARNWNTVQKLVELARA